MTGKSPLGNRRTTSGADDSCRLAWNRGEQRTVPRAVLLTLAGWTSPRIVFEAFGVREDTVRLWRSDFMNGGVAALKASARPVRPR